MDFFNGIGNWFRGAFGGDDEKKKRKPEQQQPKPQPPKPKQPQIQNVNQLFGAKDKSIDQFGAKPNQPKPPVTTAPKPEAPKPIVPAVDYEAIKQKAAGYQKPQVQDVNNYYGNDLKVLNDELAKGDKADINRVRGVMQSLDNRRNELKEFHAQRGENQSFKSARNLEKKIQETRGDWTAENAKLKQFWDSVGKNEANDFITYLNEKGVTKPADQRQAALNLMESQESLMVKPKGAWRNGGANFEEDAKRIEGIKARQEIADMAMSDEIKDLPLDQLGGSSFSQYLEAYNKQEPSQQRDTIKRLEKTLEDNANDYAANPDLLRKTQQTMVLYNLLLDRGSKKEDFGTKLSDVGDGVGGFLGALVESPGKVVQSADVLRREMFMGGKDRGTELTEAFRKGELNPEEYNKQMNEYARSLEWAGDGSEGRGKDALKALGISADTVATFLPVGSAIKGGKLATTAAKGGTELTEQAAKNAFRNTLIKEGSVNAGFSGVGALREGEVNPDQIAAETAMGAGIGVAAPIVGNQATKLWNRLRNGKNVLPEAVEDIGRVTNQVDDNVAEEIAQEGVEGELRAILNDPNQPAFRRKQAQEILDNQVRETEPPVAPETGIDRPAYMVRQDIQRIIATEEKNFNDYLNANPELTQAQIEAAQQAARDRVNKLVDDIKASRMANDEMIEGQTTAQAEAAKAREGVAEQVADDRVQAVTPQQGDEATPPPVDEEVLANDAYASQYQNTVDMTDEILRQADIDPSQPGARESGMAKFFNRVTLGGARNWYKEQVDKIRDAISDKVYEATASGNVFSQAPNRIASLFANNAGLKDGIRQILRIRNDMQTAAGDAVKRLHDNISDKVAQLNTPPEVFNQRLDQIFETPEFLARKYGEGTPNLTLDALPPAERAIVDQLIEANKLRNLALYRQGKISIGEYKMFEDGMHSPRLYDFERKNMGSRGNKLIDTTSTKKRNELSDISDETFEKLIDSPAQRMLIRLEMAMRSNASNDALKAFDEAGMLLNAAPNNQFSKLEGARWGNYQGKYIYNPLRGQLEDSIVMNTEAGQAFNDLLDKYRESPFGKVDRFMKKTKTVYSPGTFIGNVASNPLLFNRGAGVNVIGQGRRMAVAGKDLVAHRTGKSFNPDIYEAQRYGVFSSDTGKQITGENNPELTVTKNKRVNPFESAYGGADDAAKLAIWRGLRSRGVPPETAARRVAQFTQDYNNAGRLVRSLADMPVIGKPFARFAPELVRLTKNNLMYNPVGMVAGVAGLAMLQDELSRQADETPEEREARETGMGQTLIPGTAWLNKMLTGTDRDVSMNFPIGESAINIARAVGLNFPQDESGDPNMALLKSIVPWAIPTRENAQGNTEFAPEELFTSLAWSPIAQQIANRDFMGREITDPENRTYYEDGSNEVRKFDGEPTGDAQLQNRLAQLFMAYVPLANETQAVGNAVLGNEDYYGKDRTPMEAWGRVFGLKAESNTQEDQAERVETKQYFEEDLEAVQNFVTQNPDLAESYFKLKNPTRGRTNNTKVSDLVTPEKWDIINSDTSGRLFNFLKEQAVAQHEKSIQERELDPSKPIRPIDPVFQLPPDQAKYVQELRSRPSGDDIEAQDILRATSTWFEGYENAYFNYLDENSKYFDAIPKTEGAAEENPRVAEYGDASKPIEQPEIIKEYFRIKGEDPEQAKAVYKANKDALSEAFDTYAQDRLDRINKLRKIEGYEPISLEVYKNKTFGFDTDGGGFSFGSGGGGGSDINTLGELTSYSNDVKRYAPVEAQAMPNIAQLFAALQATKGGGRAKPKLGASSRGQ